MEKFQKHSNTKVTKDSEFFIKLSATFVSFATFVVKIVFLLWLRLCRGGSRFSHASCPSTKWTVRRLDC